MCLDLATVNSFSNVRMRPSSLISFCMILCSCLINTLPVQILFRDEPSSHAIQEIEQTLNTFSHAVDTHDFALLDLVFAPNATANFDDGRGTLRGLTAISTQLQSGLTGTITHHSLSTHWVRLVSPTKASSASYLQGTFFGQGDLAGQISTTYGRYVRSRRCVLTDLLSADPLNRHLQIS